MEISCKLKSKNSSYAYYLNNFWKTRERKYDDECLENAVYMTEENYHILHRKIEEKIEEKRMKDEKISRYDLTKLIDKFKIPDYNQEGGRIVYINADNGKLFLKRSGIIYDICPIEDESDVDSALNSENDPSNWEILI